MVYNELIAEMIAKLPTNDKIELLEALKKNLGIDEVKKLGKHCPLCGGDLIIDRTIDNWTWVVHCEKCGVGGLCGDRDDDEDLPTPKSLAYGKEMRLEAKSEFEEDDDYDDEELEHHRCCCHCKHSEDEKEPECHCHDDKHSCFDFTDEECARIKAESWVEDVAKVMGKVMKELHKH